MTPPLLRVIQLNAGSLLEPDWEDRRHEIVDWLRFLDPDVVCLQEIWERDGEGNTAGWLVDQLEDQRWSWVFGGHPFGDRVLPDPSVVFGSAILSRWPIDAHTLHRLPVAHDDDPFVTDTPWELLHASTAGLDVFSTHLAPAPHHGDHRCRQVVAIDRIIGEVRGDRDRLVGFGPRPGMPPILCGDFNAEPDSDEIRFLTSLTAIDGRTTFYQDAWRVAGDGPGHTQDWRSNPIAADLNIHRKRIDYVFVGDPFRRAESAGRVVAVGLCFHETRTGTVASDHAGVVADIVWPDRPPLPA